MSDAREQQLLSENEALKRENANLLAREAQMRQQMRLLAEKVSWLSQRLFGKKSEQLSDAQLLLLFQEFEAPGPLLGKEYGPEATLANPPRPKQLKPRKRRAIDLSRLPVVEERIEPLQVQAAPNDWRCIGEEVSERLDVEPARFFRVRIVRPKYVKKSQTEKAPITAPLPPSLLEGSIVTPGLLAHILVGKYCDHIPLYRQESIWASRHQLHIPRQTMVEWVKLGAEWLKPIYEEMRREVFAREYVQIDETPIRYLCPGDGKTKIGYLWTVCDPSADVIFHWETSRAAACLERIVPKTYRGIIQCDAYPAYGSFAESRGGEIDLAGCMAHARRGFVEAAKSAPQSAAWILIHFQNLYEIEAKLRQARAGPGKRKAVRSAESAPILRRMRRALLKWQRAKRFLPKSLMGEAIAYALGQWQLLAAYLNDGRIEIDNNRVENAIRPTAVGKKNWLFVGDAKAGDRAAIVYTLIEACRRREIDPFEYLRDVFRRLPSMTNWRIKEVTPEAWRQARRHELKAAA